MRGHRLSDTTHTVELRQIAELNDGLATEAGLPFGDGATLKALHAEGPPSYPYVFGTVGSSRGPRRRVPLHTPHLRAVSGALGMRHHVWGW